MNHRLKLAVLISGNGSNLQAIIDAIAQGLAAEIAIVISDKEQAFGLERAKKAGIPTKIFTAANYQNRDAFDRAIQESIESYQVDLIILAGYMRILGSEFVNAFPNRILNIHPALLPKYPGLKTYEAVLAAKEQKHGTTVHIVTRDLDSGPILAQAETNIETNETIETLKAKVQKLEHQLYPAVINLFAEHRLKIQNQQIYFNDQLLVKTGLQFRNGNFING